MQECEEHLTEKSLQAGLKEGEEEDQNMKKEGKEITKSSVLAKEKKVNGSKCSFSGKSKTKNNNTRERESPAKKQSDGDVVFEFHLWDDLDWLRAELNSCGEEWMLEGWTERDHAGHDQKILDNTRRATIHDESQLARRLYVSEECISDKT